MPAQSSASTSAPPSAAQAEALDSGSDSDDGDFVPDASGPQSPRQRTAPARRRRSRSAQGSDAGSSGEDSDGEAAAAPAEAIDDDELEALKRERSELVAAAGGEDRLGKRRRLAQHDAAAQDASRSTGGATEGIKSQADAEWEAMKASESAPHTASDGLIPPPAAAGAAGDDMVAVPTTFKFAGEVQTSTRLLPRSHPDAVAYLDQSKATVPAAVSAPAPRAGPGPRRKKGSSLASLSAAATAKPTKINTLEKSKMDWDRFKHNPETLSQHERDQLDAQTAGGSRGLGDMKGYLDRRDFLDRVHDRTSKP